ncbi:MAG: hypothetical protein QNJ40_23425 [Xanthomonadales bacterium]|nr:hypothetical protein [Xanthomonadales bacterium]
MNTHWIRLLTMMAVAVSATALGDDHHFRLNDGMYANPQMANEGVSITFTTGADGGRDAFAAWYTYDEFGNQRYLAGSGDVETHDDDFGAVEFARLEMYTTHGGVYGPEPLPTDATLAFFDDVTIYARDCNTIALDVGADKDLIMLERFPAAHDCEQTLISDEELLALREAVLVNGDNNCSPVMKIWDIRLGFVYELTLSDGLVWRVDQADQGEIADWYVGDDVLICPSDKSAYAVMTSLDANEAVGVKLVGMDDDLPPR